MLNDFLNTKYVKIQSNSGTWEILDYANDNSIIVVKHLDTGNIGKFPINRATPLNREELSQANLDLNITQAISSDIEIFEEEPIKKSKRRKKRYGDISE